MFCDLTSKSVIVGVRDAWCRALASRISRGRLTSFRLATRSRNLSFICRDSSRRMLPGNLISTHQLLTILYHIFISTPFSYVRMWSTFDCYILLYSNFIGYIIVSFFNFSSQHSSYMSKLELKLRFLFGFDAVV